MAKIVDITERLSGGEPPELQVRGERFPLRDDAATVLQVLALMGDGNPSTRDVLAAMDLLMAPGDRERLLALGLSFQDYLTVMAQAITLVSAAGGGEPGEATARTTT